MASTQLEIQETGRGESLDKERIGRYRGQVVYLFAFDVAYEMSRIPVTELLGQPLAQFAIDSSKRSPRQLFFYKPQMVRLPASERIGPHGPVRVHAVVKLLPVGAISISVHVPFEVNQVEELVAYHDLHFNNGILYEDVRRLAEEVRDELRPYFIKPTSHLLNDEAYTVFCLQSPLLSEEGVTIPAEVWWKAHRREVAGLLTQENNVACLSAQESDESTGRFLSYYEHDLVVVDWDAALVVDELKNFEEIVYIMELANLQLAELEAYDRLLDDALERAYRDLRQPPLRRRGEVLRELREIRIDLARFSDELSNITKFFGDWHLARIYQALNERFHLADWHRAANVKLKTLDDLYQLLHHDQTNRWMLMLEATIVLLFIIDLIILFAGLKMG